MATQPRLVNKQFNSPIGLYSPQNINEVIERESQILANGAVGINFHNPVVDKPANLKNSAVLRMLEEESNQRNGFGPGSEYFAKPLRENITWPPPEYERKNQHRSTFKDVVTPGTKRVTWPPPNDSGLGSPYSENSSVTAQGGPQLSPSGVHQNNYQAPSAQHQVVNPNTQSRSPLKPLDVTQHGASPLNSPVPNQTPQGFKPVSPSKGWAPVHSPSGNPSQPSWQRAPGTHYQSAHQAVTQQSYLGQQYQPSSEDHYQFQTTISQHQPSPQQYQTPSQQYQAPPQQQYQTSSQQYQSSPQQTSYQQSYSSVQEYQTPQQQYQSSTQTQKIQTSYQVSSQQYQTSSQQYQSPTIQQQQSYQKVPPQFTPKPQSAQIAPKPQQKPFEPPPSTITLRPQPPVNQAPPPVFTSQPATATLKGGKHLRGDLKWPPEECKKQAEEENRLRLELAKGPAFRPKRPNKDYTEFFAQHALNATYPGYKIPPGTQFYKPA